MGFAISYVSTASAAFRQEDIHQLLEYVKSNNDALQISGMLMYSDGNFFQVLEGEKEAVTAVFEKIKKDHRHYDIIPIIQHPIALISFTEYQTSFTTIKNRSELQELYTFLEHQKILYPELYHSISSVASKFILLPEQLS